MSQQIQQLISDKKKLQEQLQGEDIFKKREQSLGKQIDDLISEKKKLKNELADLERNSKTLLKEKNDQIAKYESSYRKYEDAIQKITKLE